VGYNLLSKHHFAAVQYFFILAYRHDIQAFRPVHKLKKGASRSNHMLTCLRITYKYTPPPQSSKYF